MNKHYAAWYEVHWYEKNSDGLWERQPRRDFLTYGEAEAFAWQLMFGKTYYRDDQFALPCVYAMDPNYFQFLPRPEHV